MATEFGLFNENREFLISVNYAENVDEISYEPERAWVRVRLMDGWDIAGSEVEQLRGHFAAMFTTRFVPEFWVPSLDRRMLMNTTIWGDGTVSTIVMRPDRLTGRSADPRPADPRTADIWQVDHLAGRPPHRLTG